MVNNIFKLAAHWELRDETVFLTVNLIDRYLSMTIVDGPKEMNLIAAASLLIATKYEEIYPPSGHDILRALTKQKSKDEPFSTC